MTAATMGALGGAAAFALAVTQLRLPGLQPGLLAEVEGGLGALPPLGPSLLLFGGLAAWDPFPAQRRGWVGVYLVAVAVQALSTARLLETVHLGPTPLVLAPGGAFRALVVLTTLAAGSLLWWLSERVEATGWVRGPLWVAGWAAVPMLTQQVGADAVAAASGADPSFGAVVALVGAASTWAVWSLLRPEHPVIRSVGGAALVPVAAWSLTRHDLGSGWLAGAGVVLVWVLALTSPRTRPSWLALLGAPLPLAVGGLAALGGLVQSGSLERRLGPGPFDGPIDATVELIASPAAPAGDLDVIAARLEGLGIAFSFVERGPSRVVLALFHVRDPEVVLEAVARPQVVTVRGVVPAGEGEVARESCWQGRCEALELGPSLIDRRGIRDASVGWNGGEFPQVTLVFTDEATTAFADHTTAHVGERVAILRDEVVLMAPVVREPIVGGRAMIDLGADPDPQVSAHALAVALTTPPLEGHWTTRVIDVDVAR